MWTKFINKGYYYIHIFKLKLIKIYIYNNYYKLERMHKNYGNEDNEIFSPHLYSFPQKYKIFNLV